MTNQMDVATWINSEAAKKTPPVKSSYGHRNGNMQGRFQEDMLFEGGGKKFVVSADSEYCVYGSMGGKGTAATIFDPVYGDITVYKDGRIKRRPPRPTSTRPSRLPRMDASLGIS